jgi:hypothetical protein
MKNCSQQHANTVTNKAVTSVIDVFNISSQESVIINTLLTCIEDIHLSPLCL